MTARGKTVEAITAHGDATYACGEWDGEYQSDRYETVKETADRTRAALLAAIAAEVAEEREAIATAIDLRWAAELEMRDQRRKAGDLEMSRMHADRAHVLREQAAAIRARKEAGLGEGN